nr:xyloglucan galactosyltransferase XLT2-like [Ipomoea batatas]
MHLNLPIPGNKQSTEQRPRPPLQLKYALQSVKSQVPLNQCVFLVATIFLQIWVLFSLIHSSPAKSGAGHHHLVPHRHDCSSGKVYVYEAPRMFNYELVENCNELDPWKATGCKVVANGGFGLPAKGLESVVPENLLPAWYWTDMYSAELIYHERMLNHQCRTMDPEEATGFFIPFYAGIAVGKFLFTEFNYTYQDRDRYCNMFLDWLEEQPSFARYKAVDHFIMLGRLTWDFRRLADNSADWGTSLLYMPRMKNVFRLGVEKHLKDRLEESVPYPTGFHPRSEADIRQWQTYIRSQKRDSLFTFVGAKRHKIKNDFRGMLMDYCIDEEDCRAVDCSAVMCSDGSPAVFDAFLHSNFCLQPKGDGMTRRSMYDCMISGAIPVYFWRGTFKDQYVWHLPWISETFTVYVDNNDVRKSNGTVIKDVLKRVHPDNVRQMRETLIDLMPKMLYASRKEGLGSIRDAFDITLDRVLKRLKARKSHLLSGAADDYEIF